MKLILSTLFVLSLTLLPVFAGAQDDSLVLYFSFDAETKDDIKDLSKHENHGTISGNPKWDTGKIGKAVTFDAVDDQVVVPTSKSLDIEKEITMMAWINAGKDLMADWRTIIGKSPTNVLGQTTFSYDIRTDKDGKLRFSLNMGGWQHIIGPVAEIGKWSHVAGTYDGSEMVFYLNGAEIGKKPVKGKINVTADPVGIGNIVDAGGASQNEYWAGHLDEVKVWNRGLSNDEVKQQMNLEAKDILAVNSGGKLATAWGRVKAR
jgi:hypothetical protein